MERDNNTHQAAKNHLIWARSPPAMVPKCSRVCQLRSRIDAPSLIVKHMHTIYDMLLLCGSAAANFADSGLLDSDVWCWQQYAANNRRLLGEFQNEFVLKKCQVPTYLGSCCRR